MDDPIIRFVFWGPRVSVKAFVRAFYEFWILVQLGFKINKVDRNVGLLVMFPWI